MTIYQERKLSMFLATKERLSQTATSIINAMPGFSAYVTSFNTNVATLQATREVQEVDRSGIAVNKREIQIDLIAKSIDVAKKVKAYAINNSNSVLANEVSYTESDLKRSADTILRDKCMVIYTKANANATALASYGITSAQLTALLSLINSFNAAIPKPRIGVTTKKQATEQIDALFASTDAILTKMDILVEILKTSQPEFYQNYTDARMLIDASYSKLAFRGIVKDKESSLPVSGVEVVISESDVKVKTSAKGYFQMKHLASGTYVFVFKKAGYKTKEETIHITEGERTELRVVLEKKEISL